jgi:hypothetical protein
MKDDCYRVQFKDKRRAPLISMFKKSELLTKPAAKQSMMAIQKVSSSSNNSRDLINEMYLRQN